MNSSKLNILFFHFDLGEGGAERVLVNLLNNLNPDKYNITLRTIFSGNINRRLLAPHIKFKPLFNRLPFRGMKTIFKLFPPKLLSILLIRGCFDYSIAFLEGIPTRILGGRDKTKAGKKIAWVHTAITDSKILTKAFRNLNEFNRIYHNFDKIAFVSKMSLSQFEKFYDISVPKNIVHNVNDFSSINIKSKEYINIRLDPQKINLISVGRLTKVKRFDRLIRALSNLFMEGNKNWHLYLVGKGELENELRSLTHTCNLESHISFLGFQENPYKYISKMDLFVCSSEREGFSTSVTEASYLGIPVITSDCGGMDEIIIEGQNGFIVPNSLEGIQNGIKHYFSMSNGQHDNLKNNASNLRHRFSMENTLKEFEGLLQFHLL